MKIDHAWAAGTKEVARLLCPFLSSTKLNQFIDAITRWDNRPTKWRRV